MKSLLVFFFLTVSLFSQDILFFDDFQNLDSWIHTEFPNVNSITEYNIIHNNEESYLKAKSDDGASFLLHKERFDPFEYPIVEWRWKVDNLYKTGDARRRSGDDFPMRIYIAFEYDASQVNFAIRTLYSAIRLIYGQYPPHSALNYVWGNVMPQGTRMNNAFTSRAKMIFLQSGETYLGLWKTESIHIIDDYRDLFGTDPPRTASILIMNDSNNTGEASTAYLDFIRVSKEQKHAAHSD